MYIYICIYIYTYSNYSFHYHYLLMELIILVFLTPEVPRAALSANVWPGISELKKLSRSWWVCFCSPTWKNMRKVGPFPERIRSKKLQKQICETTMRLWWRHVRPANSKVTNEGSNTIQLFLESINTCHLIRWNNPLGNSLAEFLRLLKWYLPLD